MTSEIEYQCNNCGHEGINTSAVPDVPELVRYRLNQMGELVYSENGQYVLHSQAAAIIEAKDALIFEHQNENVTLQICLDKVLKRVEAAEAKLEHYNGVKGVNTQYSNALANLGMTEDDDPETFADVINDKLEELARHKAARQSYADLFDGDVGSIHENIRNLKAELAQIKAQVPIVTLHVTRLGTDIKYKKNCLPVGDHNLYAAPVDQTAEIEKLWAIALSLCDHMEMVNDDLFDRDKPHQNPNISSMRLAIDEARAALSGEEIEDDNPSEQAHFLHHLKELAEVNMRAAKEAEDDFQRGYELRRKQEVEND